MFRLAGNVDVPRTGVMISASMQYFTGKPWTASALVQVPQNNQQRVLIEPRGSRRLRRSRCSTFGSRGRSTLPAWGASS
jgi:hypothetical protein